MAWTLKKSHDLKDLPLLTHIHRSHQPYLNLLVNCGLFFLTVFVVLHLCSQGKAAIFLDDFANVDRRSLNGPISCDKARVRKSVSLSYSWTFLHMYTH